MQTVVLSSDLIQSLCLTPEKLKAAGLRQDELFAVSLEDGRIVLKPADPMEALRGVFAGGPSMADEVIEERRRDEALSKQKLGW